MKILVIDDEHRIAEAIRQGLKLEGYVADVAYNGVDGYDLASSEEYDLLILDWMLPGMDGIEVCKRLRIENNHVPILMLSAKGQIDDKVMGFEVGADDYLTKPFAFEELLARVKALIRRPWKIDNQIQEIGDMILDPSAYTVKRQNQDIELSKKEMGILSYLVKNQNRVVTKAQIIQHVWEYDSEVMPNTVEVFVKHIRAKIEKPFGDIKTKIKTIRGIGYKIENKDV